MGGCTEFHRRMRFSSLSTTVTRIWGLLKAMTAAVGPPRGLLVYEHSTVTPTRLTNIASANTADVANWWCPGRSVEQRGRQRPGGTLGFHSGDPRLLVRSLEDGTEGQVASWGRWRSGDVETNVVPQVESRGQLKGHCLVLVFLPETGGDDGEKGAAEGMKGEASGPRQRWRGTTSTLRNQETWPDSASGMVQERVQERDQERLPRMENPAFRRFRGRKGKRHPEGGEASGWFFLEAKTGGWT